MMGSGDIRYRLEKRDGQFKVFEESLGAMYADAPFSQEDREMMKNNWERLVIQHYINRQQPVSVLQYGNRQIIAITAQDAEHVMTCVHSLWEEKAIADIQTQLDMLNTIPGTYKMSLTTISKEDV